MPDDPAWPPSGTGSVEDATGVPAKEDPVHPISQLAFDLDVASAPPAVMGAPPDDLPEQDRAAAVRKLASLIARRHASEGSTGDDE